MRNIKENAALRRPCSLAEIETDLVAEVVFSIFTGLEVSEESPFSLSDLSLRRECLTGLFFPVRLKCYFSDRTINSIQHRN